MKKILLILAILLLLPVKIYAAENVVPDFVSLKNNDAIGLYQAPNEIVLYKEPTESSTIVHSISWIGSQIFPQSINADDLFVVYMPKKNLGFLAVVDETEDWVQVRYDNDANSLGWIKNDDPYRFMSWIMFYNMYGKKYGLKLLKEAPEDVKNIHASSDDNSQIISTINMPQKINLTAIKGNWALVSVLDIDKTPKTGFVRWRSNNGVKYYFPNIKN